MDNTNFKGIFTALLTPFGDDGSINRESLKKLIGFNLKAGVNGFYVGGSTGEGVLMSRTERKTLFREVAECNAGASVLIGHVGATSTEEAVELGKDLKALGYAAVSAVAPFYYAHSYRAIKNYYSDIADCCGLPVVIYNYPLSGAFSLTPEKAQDMTRDGRIVAVKHTSQDLFALERFKSIENAPIVYNGYDEMLAAGLIMGADGGIGSTYNFMPHKIVKIYRLFQEGKLKEVMEEQKIVNGIIAEALGASSVCGMMNVEKEILTAMGIPMGSCKKPFLPADAEAKAKAADIAAKLLTEIGDLL